MNHLRLAVGLLVAWPAAPLVASQPPMGNSAEIHHVDASFVVDGRLLSGRFTDVDGDERKELVLGVRREDGRRELRIHRWRPDGLPDPVAAQVVVIKDDVIAWALADVRDEPGRELVFLTRSGAFSYSLQHPGYSNNIARLVESPMFFDLVDHDGLDEWAYVLPRPGGDALLLPGPTGYAVWGPGDEGYAIECDLLTEQMSGLVAEAGSGRRVEIGPGKLKINGQDVISPKARFPHEHGVLPWAAFLSTSHEIHSPALIDLDGDGRTDLLTRKKASLEIHLATDEGVPGEPTRTEEYPELMTRGDVRRDIGFHDLDGDGDLDALIRLRDDRDGFSIGEITVRFVIMKNDGAHLLHDEPHQILTFSGMSVRGSVADINGDGLPDLVIEKVGAPGLGDLVTIADGLEFTRTTMAFYGKGGASFSRSPDLDPPAVSFDEDSIQDAVSRRLLSQDFDGDGVADLVDVDLTGHITIFRVRKESGFFTGETWVLDDVPWKRFEVRGDIRDLDADDVNGDGLGDVLSFRENGVTLLLSRGGGASR